MKVIVVMNNLIQIVDLVEIREDDVLVNIDGLVVCYDKKFIFKIIKLKPFFKH